jgi:hypothetical protein
VHNVKNNILTMDFKIGGFIMKTNAPHLVTWIIAVVIGGLGIVSKVAAIPSLPVSDFGLVAIGFILLVIGTIFTGI